MISANKYYNPDRGPDLRRTPVGQPRKTFQVKEMWDKHLEIARLLHLGMTGRDIAKQMGVTEAMVSYTKNSRVVEDRLEIMRYARDADTIDLSKRIMKFGPRCLDLLEDIIEGKGQAKDVHINLRAKYADKHLGRMGHGEVKKVQQATMHLTPAEIQDIKDRARSNGVLINKNEEIIDVN